MALILLCAINVGLSADSIWWIPYTDDIQTLGLWHFDDVGNTSTTFADDDSALPSRNNNGARPAWSTVIEPSGAGKGSGIGLYGNSLASFSYSSSHQIVDDNTDMEFGTSFTIEAWIKPNLGDLSGVHGIAIKGNPASDGWGFGLSGGKLWARVHSYKDNVVIGNTVLQANTWYHVAAVFAANLTNGWEDHVLFYVNGVLDADKVNPPDGDFNHNNLSLIIGVGDRSNSYNFGGRIDEVRYSDGIRTFASYSQTADVNVVNMRFGYLANDSSPTSGSLGNWCIRNSDTSKTIALDTTQNSIGIDLGESTTVNAITVASWDTMLSEDGSAGSRWEPRLSSSNTRIYYSNDNVTYTQASSYTTRSDTDARMTHLPYRNFHFENLSITARYIKVHCTLTDDNWSWMNYQDRSITVAGPAITGDWYPAKAAAQHRTYSWAATCLPFGATALGGIANLCGSSSETCSSGSVTYHARMLPQVLAKVRQAKILWQKIGYFDQSAIEPLRGSYDFNGYDECVAMYRNYGIRMLGSFNKTAQWNSADANQSEWWRLKPKSWQDYQDFVTTVASRYRNDIQFWEGWNEVNWLWSSNMGDYVTLLNAIYNGVKAADANMMVLCGGFSGTGLYQLERVFSLGGGQYMDVCGFHFYARTPTAMANKVQAVRDILDYYGYVDMPIWGTEQGWSTGPEPADGGVAWVASEQAKADYLTQTLDAVLPYMQVFLYYSLSEPWGDTDHRMYGLLTQFMTEPAYLVENTAYTTYKNYISSWYTSHGTSQPSPACGDEPLLAADLNLDCRVDLQDTAIFISQWLICSDLSHDQCSAPALNGPWVKPAP